MLTREVGFRRRVAALAAAVTLISVAGCGVKSKPATPEGSTYPLAYPAGAPRDTAAPKAEKPAAQPRTMSPAPATGDDGTYTPPPAATDPNFR